MSIRVEEIGERLDGLSDRGSGKLRSTQVEKSFFLLLVWVGIWMAKLCPDSRMFRLFYLVG